MLACSPATEPVDAGPEPPLAREVIAGLSMERVRDDVDLLAADERGGRVPGSPGHRFARDWLAAEMAAAGLEPAGEAFVVEHQLQLDRARKGLDEQGRIYDVPLDQAGYNVLGLRPGASEEVVLLVAHYDHLGVDEEGNAYNGAFDDITAVCALLELARVLDEHDVTLPRTLGFLFTDAEEDGLDGAYAWVAEPTVPLPSIVAALSVDPIGRPILPDFMPLMAMGAERSPEMAAAVEAIAPFVETPMHRANRKPLLLYGSDQDAFWTAPSPVPALWISSGGMSFYHTVDDDPETIDYRSVRTHLETIAQLAAQLATAPDRPTDLGEQDLSVGDLEQAVSLLDGALGSSVLTEEERAVGEDFRELFEAAVRVEDTTSSQVRLGYAELFLYVITELTPAHPGPIPPPFPE